MLGGANVRVGKGKASEGIQLIVRDSLETAIRTVNEVTDSGTVEVQAEITGDHEIIFINPFKLQAQTVEVSYIVNP